MTKIKTKEIKNTSKQDREKRIKELELMKSQSGSRKTGNSKSKQIRKTIARILTVK